ncbi:MAG: zinc ribbon domain-containing protein [Nocardioidaceae bacterium]
MHVDEERTLKADPIAQLRLLDLQAVDAALDLLTHRLETLPQNATLAAPAERHADVSARHGRLHTAVDDLGRDQRKADADVEQVKTRRARNQERIDAGLISDPKQLQAMQHEVETLARRIGDLEDEELTVMERLESAQHERAALAGELAELDADIRDNELSRAEASGEFTAKQADSRAEREALAAEIPADLLALYEKLRAQLGGVGAGAVYQGRCTGCRLDIGSADLVRMAAAPRDDVLRCEECNRILVRTSESGI